MARPARPSLSTAPQGQCRQLTSHEVRIERVALAADMLSLLLTDDEPLPPLTQGTLRTMHQDLLRLWHEMRLLP